MAGQAPASKRAKSAGARGNGRNGSRPPATKGAGKHNWYGVEGRDWHQLSVEESSAHPMGYTWDWGPSSDAISEASSVVRVRATEKDLSKHLAMLQKVENPSKTTLEDIARYKERLKQARVAITERKPKEDQLEIQRNRADVLRKKDEELAAEEQSVQEKIRVTKAELEAVLALIATLEQQVAQEAEEEADEVRAVSDVGTQFLPMRVPQQSAVPQIVETRFNTVEQQLIAMQANFGQMFAMVQHIATATGHMPQPGQAPAQPPAPLPAAELAAAAAPASIEATQPFRSADAPPMSFMTPEPAGARSPASGLLSAQMAETAVFPQIPEMPNAGIQASVTQIDVESEHSCMEDAAETENAETAQSKLKPFGRRKSCSSEAKKETGKLPVKKESSGKDAIVKTPPAKGGAMAV